MENGRIFQWEIVKMCKYKIKSHEKLTSMSPLSSILFPPKSWTDKELAEPLSLSNNENNVSNNVRPTIHQNSATLKALLEIFWFASWQLPVYNFANIT